MKLFGKNNYYKEKIKYEKLLLNSILYKKYIKTVKIDNYSNTYKNDIFFDWFHSSNKNKRDKIFDDFLYRYRLYYKNEHRDSDLYFGIYTNNNIPDELKCIINLAFHRQGKDSFNFMYPKNNDYGKRPNAFIDNHVLNIEKYKKSLKEQRKEKRKKFLENINKHTYIPWIFAFFMFLLALASFLWGPGILLSKN